ncbi:MAG: LysR substrate-binding domain-containing protein [Candidatus Sphingomonas phytovorans]|nr:LysR substrate-binding domain-containing protein [Sphingomonas sp.]WEK00233.1 MAG: LysR substrate-binding domain-containing protein [Sphingomonas sp.]
MNESRRSLPPMAALNSFVAAARYGSFSRAAEHIGLTQSAVSRQIALLEEWLQTSLFDRHGRRITLNAAGRAYADEVRPALDRIRLATDQFANGAGRTLLIATLPSFGMRWLAPRLPGLSARHPEMTVNFAARSFPFDLKEEGFDGAIHFGQPDWPDASHLHLFGERAVVVCGADWLARNPIESPRDLIDKPLLFQASRLNAWNRWFTARGIADPPKLEGQRFEHFLMLAQAVAAGAGVALIPEFLISPELANGSLVMPFEQPLLTDDAYYLVRRLNWRDNGAMVDFSAWMDEQVDAVVKSDIL